MSGRKHFEQGSIAESFMTNQVSNMLAGDLLGMSTTIKFLNTLLGIPTTDTATMLDISLNAHNGTYKGTWVAEQRIGKGFGWILNPNGSDNYITLGDSDDFSFGTGAADIAFTIAGLIEVVNTATFQMIISKYDLTGGAELGEWYVSLDSAEKLRVTLRDESANVECFRLTDAALSAGFHTFVATYSGVGGANAANGINIYVDGVVVASTATNNGAYVAMENLTTQCWIGASKNTNPVFFMIGDFTPPIIDKSTVWTALMVMQFHQYMKGVYGL